MSWQNIPGETEFLLSVDPDTCQGSSKKKRVRHAVYSTHTKIL